MRYNYRPRINANTYSMSFTLVRDKFEAKPEKRVYDLQLIIRDFLDTYDQYCTNISTENHGKMSRLRRKMANNNLSDYAVRELLREIFDNKANRMTPEISDSFFGYGFRGFLQAKWKECIINKYSDRDTEFQAEIIKEEIQRAQSAMIGDKPETSISGTERNTVKCSGKRWKITDAYRYNAAVFKAYVIAFYNDFSMESFLDRFRRSCTDIHMWQMDYSRHYTNMSYYSRRNSWIDNRDYNICQLLDWQCPLALYILESYVYQSNGAILHLVYMLANMEYRSNDIYSAFFDRLFNIAGKPRDLYVYTGYNIGRSDFFDVCSLVAKNFARIMPRMLETGICYVNSPLVRAGNVQICPVAGRDNAYILKYEDGPTDLIANIINNRICGQVFISDLRRLDGHLILNFEEGEMNGRQIWRCRTKTAIWYVDLAEKPHASSQHLSRSKFNPQNIPCDPVFFYNGIYMHAHPGDEVYKLCKSHGIFTIVKMRIQNEYIRDTSNKWIREHATGTIVHPWNLREACFGISVPCAYDKFRTNLPMRILDIYDHNDPNQKHATTSSCVYGIYAFKYEKGTTITFARDSTENVFPGDFNYNQHNDCGVGIHFHLTPTDCAQWILNN